MKLYRYWAFAETQATDPKGRRLSLKKWGGANTSIEDARSAARRAVDALSARIALSGLTPQDTYSYSQRDIPEELVRTLSPESGVTRNGQGCLVLNTNELFFADIDVRRPGFIARLCGASVEKEETKYLDKLKAWLLRNPHAGARAYRTAAGMRYIFTHAQLTVNDDTLGWLKELGSDRLYVRLCAVQKCFRARLTPKRWRMGLKSPPGRFPHETPAAQAAFASWRADYEARCAEYAVCRFVGAYGSASVPSPVQALVNEHDAATGCGKELPLA